VGKGPGFSIAEWRCAEFFNGVAVLGLFQPKFLLTYENAFFTVFIANKMYGSMFQFN
jgi:hypothetical protein